MPLILEAETLGVSPSGAKRVLGTFLEGEDGVGGAVERGFLGLGAGLARAEVDEETDLARGLRVEDIDAGLGCIEEASALAISSSESTSVPVRAFLVARDRVRTLL